MSVLLNLTRDVVTFQIGILSLNRKMKMKMIVYSSIFVILYMGVGNSHIFRYVIVILTFDYSRSLAADSGVEMVSRVNGSKSQDPPAACQLVYT